MDGRGRDNIFIERLWRSLKHEDIYLKHCADGRETRAGIASWIAFYNTRHPHRGLGYTRPHPHKQKAAAAQKPEEKRTAELPTKIPAPVALTKESTSLRPLAHRP